MLRTIRVAVDSHLHHGAAMPGLPSGTELARARNMMMQLMVDDLDAWWSHLEALDLPGRVGTTMLRAPAMQPWGLRVGFVADPDGVLWHVAERRPGVVQD